MTYIAVDIGATNVRVASGDAGGITEKRSELTDVEEGSLGVSKQVIRLIDEILDESPEGIGVGCIGPIDLERGEIAETPNYPFNHIPVVEPLSTYFGVETSVANDCATAVLGEQMFGAGTGIENLVYVTLSTGLGGGAIVDNNLLMGKEGNAVEIGHYTVDMNSTRKCGCGCYGHWEAYCGGKNIPSFIKELLENNQGTIQGRFFDSQQITSETLYNAAQQGDELAMHLVYEIGKINAVGFANIVNVFDPELITIGGSIANRNPSLTLTPILENIDNHLINRKPEILITPLGDDAVLMGALALAMRD